VLYAWTLLDHVLYTFDSLSAGFPTTTYAAIGEIRNNKALSSLVHTKVQM
jgi:hypothetical protein